MKYSGMCYQHLSAGLSFSDICGTPNPLTLEDFHVIWSSAKMIN